MMSDHESSLQTEATTAKLIQVFKSRPQEVHHHNIDAFVSGSLLTAPHALREPLQVMPVRRERSEKLRLVRQLRVLDIRFFL